MELLFANVVRDLGAPTLVVRNIDGRVPGIFRKGIAEADPSMVLATLRNSAFSAFLVGQQAARLMRENKPNANGAKGTIIFTNASAALKGYPSSGAFAMACHAKSGLAQSMARELMPHGIHVANVAVDAAIGWTQEDGTRAHRLAGTTVGDNMADPNYVAETYLQLHGVGRLGRLRSCYARGSRSGDRRSGRSVHVGNCGRKRSLLHRGGAAFTPLNDRTGTGELSATIEERLLSGKGDASLSI